MAILVLLQIPLVSVISVLPAIKSLNFPACSREKCGQERFAMPTTQHEAWSGGFLTANWFILRLGIYNPEDRIGPTHGDRHSMHISPSRSCMFPLISQSRRPRDDQATYSRSQSRDGLNRDTPSRLSGPMVRVMPTLMLLTRHLAVPWHAGHSAQRSSPNDLSLTYNSFAN